jgi:ankyrin repeat protein
MTAVAEKALFDDLVIGVTTNDASFLAEMLAKGTDEIDRFDKDGFTLLTLAVEQDNPDLVKILLDAGATPDLADDRGFAPLQLDITDEIKSLLEKAVEDRAHAATETASGVQRDLSAMRQDVLRLRKRPLLIRGMAP